MKIKIFFLLLLWKLKIRITIGYGDILPVSNVEKLYVIINTLFSCGVFGYSINSIGSIF